MSIPAASKKRLPLAELPMQVGLAGMGVLLLSWPIVQVAGEHGTIHWAMYLFAVWVGIILFLAAIGRAVGRSAAPPVDEPALDKASVGKAKNK